MEFLLSNGWALLFVGLIGFCFFMMIYTGIRNVRMNAGKNADMYLPEEMRRNHNGQYGQKQSYHENDWFMQEQLRQQNEQFMNDSMKFSMDSVTPFEHGGFNMDFGNSFNDFGAGGFGGFGF